jgi:6-phosphogluconolactonase
MGHVQSRRSFLVQSGNILLGSIFLRGGGPRWLQRRSDGSLIFYVGTYTEAGGKGIYRGQREEAGGKALLHPVAVDIENPSFVLLDSDCRHLYAVSETGAYEGRATGGVYAYTVLEESGDLRLINHQSSEGAGPCHLSLDRTGRFLLVANYTSGSVAVFPIEENGGLGAPTDVVHHRGSGPVKDRQQSAHAHCTGVDPLNRLALVADLGMDRVMIYNLDLDHGKLTPAPQPSIILPPGSGPRHFVFHPNGHRLYIVSELSSTVSTAAYDPRKGEFVLLQTISTLPQGYTGDNAPAEIAVAPSGRFVYCSNRGRDSIAAFSVDPKAGTLRFVQDITSLINWPRNFVIDPSGSTMIVANQRADSLVGFSLDPMDGTISGGALMAAVPTPVCVTLIRQP